MSWPSGNTAVLVIHGIGEQHPFETLDMFARTLWRALEAPGGGSVTAAHRLRSHESGWLESYASFERAGEPARVDLYEFYWAHRMQRQISAGEVIEWLIQVSDGARQFYAENAELATKYRDLEVGAFDRQGRFKVAWYLGLGGPLAWLLRLGVVARRSLHLPTLGLSGPVLGVVGALTSWLGGKAARLMVDFVGDIAVYTTTDRKSRHFAVRNQILREAEEEVWNLLQHYGRVIVAGHSLGSVVAYDTLSRLALRMSADPEAAALANRLVGLVTFGSPLDKIAFFFRRRTPEQQYVRRQIQAFRYGFRARYFEADRTLRELPPERRLHAGAPLPEPLERMPWLNFWNPDDPVSGYLDYYAVEPHGANINVKAPDAEGRALGKANPLAAHGAYFGYVSMYERIIREFFG